MRKFIKIMAYVLALPAALFSYGVFDGFSRYAEMEANVAEFEYAMAEMDVCGEGDEAAYNANPMCQDICESFFQCRNDYLILEERVMNEFMAWDEDVYTEEEYEAFYGKLDIAEDVAPPGTAPKPILN